MLIKRRCTATGIINFYAKNEPHIAIGSVITRIGPTPYIWHYHGELNAVVGTARDWGSVERAINAQHRVAETDRAGARHAA